MTSIALRRIAGSAFLAIGVPAAAMDMKVVGDQLILSGPIVGNELGHLRHIAAEHGDRIKTVVLRNSASGDAWTSLRVAEFVRDRGWRTVVSGMCMSGCTIIFMGGVDRHFADENPVARSRLNFHGGYSTVDGPRTFKGAANPEWTHKGMQWVKERSSGKISDAMVELFIKQDANGFVRFLDAARLPNRPSVFVCVLPEGQRRRHCEPHAGTDAYREGIVTSSVLIPVNDQPTRSARTKDAEKEAKKDSE